jgi:hypothetical protein
MKGGISTIMNLRDRIGYDAGGTPLEDALAWAAANALHYVDFNADHGPNHLDSWSDERIQAVRGRRTSAPNCARPVTLSMASTFGVLRPRIRNGCDRVYTLSSHDTLHVRRNTALSAASGCFPAIS